MLWGPNVTPLHLTNLNLVIWTKYKIKLTTMTCNLSGQGHIIVVNFVIMLLVKIWTAIINASVAVWLPLFCHHMSNQIKKSSRFAFTFFRNKKKTVCVPRFCGRCDPYSHKHWLNCSIEFNYEYLSRQDLHNWKQFWGQHWMAKTVWVTYTPKVYFYFSVYMI